ncbi:Small-subunit processome, Utp12 [Cynara cardunculus var. scolymus]|uniref:Small-subunit processome, Utp12 n=1 Tax=Cynara cardunculus var. scolymus TaxID=59895 RepID=A0A118JYM8_CYNCS|nr:Small-subunit processome, Utp12 [Cynara cardunculus var. scolymus]
MAKERVKPLMSSFTSKAEVFAALLPNGVLKVWNTSDGNLLAEWKQPDGESDAHFSCIACSFVGKKRRKEKGTCLVALGTDDGEVFTINATAAEMKRIAALSFANKGRKLCVISTDGATCEMNSESGELLKETKISKKYISSAVYFSVRHISMLEDTNLIITSGFDDKNLQVWKNEANTEIVTSGPILSMRHPSLAIECKSGCNGEDLAVLSVSENGVAYIWNMKNSSEGNIVPAKIKVEAGESETDPNVSGKKKRHTSILAARLSSVDSDDRVTGVIVYGSINSPQFTSVDVTSPGEDIVIDARADVRENGVNDGKDHGDPMDGVQIDNDIDEPTMGEKLASLNITKNEGESEEKAESSPAKPPSADSVHVLLKQALHADDRNSVYLLNPSEVFKLLESLISMIQSRGAVIACALPWLKSLLLQHSSSIMSQESSLIALNSLYQTLDDGVDEGEGPLEPIIFEDVSDEDEDGSEEDGDNMETDEEDNEELEAVSNVSDLEGSDGMAD